MNMENLRRCKKALFEQTIKMEKYCKYKVLPRDDKRIAMKKKYQHCKQIFKTYQKEYDELKRQLKYESEGDSTDSSNEDEGANKSTESGGGKKREWVDGPGAEEC